MANNTSRIRDTKGRYVPASIVKGANDSQWGGQLANNALAPKAIQNIQKDLTPIEAYQLSSAVRIAINARNEPYEHVIIRLFTKDGREITGGEAMDFCRKPNDSQTGNGFIRAIASWHDLADERFCWVHPNNYFNKKNSARLVAHALNPLSMQIVEPSYPRTPEDIRKWLYVWANGQMQQFMASEVLFSAEWNPSSQTRGASKLVSVANSVQSSYAAMRYIKAYFANNAIPSSIINVQTDNPDLIEPFKKELLSAHQGEANAFRMLFTYGSKVTIDPLEQPMQEAPFQLLIDNVRSEVASIYMTPPLVSGQFDKTRFDSAEEQNDFFYSSVWLPNVAKEQRFFQNIIDTHFRYSTFTATKGRMTSAIKKSFEKAAVGSESNIVVVLDCDHIPDVARLKAHQIDRAQQLIDTFKLTPDAACEEVGLELELSDASKLVWYKSDQKFIDPVKPVVVPEQVQPEAKPVEPEPVVEPEVDSEDTEKIKDFYRALRKLSLASMDSGTIWTLKEADELAKQFIYNSSIYKQIRIDYATIRPLIANKDKDAIKKFFNSKKPSTLRALTKDIK